MTIVKKIGLAILGTAGTFSIGLMTGMLIEKKIQYNQEDASIKASVSYLPDRPTVILPTGMNCFNDEDNHFVVCVMSTK